MFLGTATSFLRNNRGASLVEMALVTPFLLTLGLGIIEFSNALYDHHLITTGVRDAARYLARIDDPIADQSKGQQLAVYGEINGTTKRVSWWTTNDVSVTLIPIANAQDPQSGIRTYRGGNTINLVRVATDVDHPGLGFLTFLGISSPVKIRVFHEERVIGE
jgi:hypothetical protein